MAEFKIYTKTGDTGETSLVGGTRVSKFHDRIEAYGTLDELNAFVGLLADELEFDNIKKDLISIQEKLFVLGSLIAHDGLKKVKLPDLKNEDIEFLEQQIDEMQALLPQLKNFILPGGHTAVSKCHLCRVVCRRSERLVIKLSADYKINPLYIKYLNRLSDYFFVLSRRLAQLLEVTEIQWIASKD